MARWFMQENIIFREKLTKVSREPGTHVIDEAGNKVVCDVNIRAYRDLVQRRRKPNSVQIGTLKRDVSKDHWYRPIRKLKISDAKPPFDDCAS